MTGSNAKSSAIFVELGYSSLRALVREEGLELPLQRTENGRLNSDSLEPLATTLRAFLARAGARSGAPCYCAIGARGVSARRVTVPNVARDEWQRLLTLQIEREFPLSPDELAWAYCPAPERPEQGIASGGGKDWLVFAVKRAVLQDYTELLEKCGLAPVFTLSAWARSALCRDAPEQFELLDIGATSTELVSYLAGTPVAVHVLAWGSEQLSRRLATARGLPAAEADALRDQWVGDASKGAPATGLGADTVAALDAEIGALAKLVLPNARNGKLFVTGAFSSGGSLASLSRALGGLTCSLLPMVSGAGRSAVTLGLKRACETGGVLPSLQWAKSGAQQKPRTANVLVPWRWTALAILLALVSVALRYGEAIARTPELNRHLTELKAVRGQLPGMERELGFLQYLLTNQPPYLESIHALASAAPGGIRFDSLALNRRGELAVRATMRDPQQLVDFRSKLLQSGLFLTVTVDEQTPSADQQKLTVRLSGQCRRPGESKTPTPESTSPVPSVAPANLAGERLVPSAAAAAVPVLAQPSSNTNARSTAPTGKD